MASHAEEPTRRDFLTLAGGAFAAVGGAMSLWPFIHQMNPDASTQALASIEVDLKPVKEGQAITVLWRGKLPTTGGPLNPIFATAIKGTANTLMEIATITPTVTGAVYCNAQGFQAV